MSLDVEKMPGAGSLENSECILCGTCADACRAGTLCIGFGK